VLGITIGIFSIILVLSIVDSLEKNIRDSIESMGSDVVFVEKWPWEFGGDYPWWDYLNREVPRYEEYEYIKKKRSNEVIGTVCFLNKSNGNLVEYQSFSAEKVGVFGISPEYRDIQEIIIEDGRYFNTLESDIGENVCIIGHTIANDLFAGKDAIGKEIKLKKRKVKVIGVVKKEGENALGQSLDEKMLIPINFMRKFSKTNKLWGNTSIMVKAKDNIPMEHMEVELNYLMRSIRKLSPIEQPSFALNKLTMLTNQLSMVFVPINLAGAIIGGFSTLVGCFGVANIMFVSVRERTNIIGIQKSLGAKKFFILSQFLVESIFLCLIGGIIGIILVYILLAVGNVVLGNMDIGMTLAMDSGNFISGISISVIIGIISGIIPAIMAANLDPVEAIRS
jgi:putative ABC transport system permease protein